MTADIVQFRKPKSQPVTALKVAEQTSPPKLSEIKGRGAWKKALAAIWANPENWHRNEKVAAIIDIGDLELSVRVVRKEFGYEWQIHWQRCGGRMTVSKWLYVSEQIAIDESWDAVCALA
jgi:hypothetical protein